MACTVQHCAGTPARPQGAKKPRRARHGGWDGSSSAVGRYVDRVDARWNRLQLGDGRRREAGHGVHAIEHVGIKAGRRGPGGCGRGAGNVGHYERDEVRALSLQEPSISG